MKITTTFSALSALCARPALNVEVARSHSFGPVYVTVPSVPGIPLATLRRYVERRFGSGSTITCQNGSWCVWQRGLVRLSNAPTPTMSVLQAALRESHRQSPRGVLP